MFNNGIETVSQFEKNGDILSIFKPTRDTLGSHYSKSIIPLNLFNRKNRRIAYALLEIIVESRGMPSEWKLKLDNINITRQFKPTYAISLEGENKNIYKFVYDVTSVLNTSDILSKEWINLLVKYEGGDVFTVRAILLDAVYEDADAQTIYEHGTGLTLIESGKTYRYPVRTRSNTHLTTRIVTYTTRKVNMELRAGSCKTNVYTHPDNFEEYLVLSDTKPEYVEIVNLSDPSKGNPILISSITIYENNVKHPVLEVCGVDYSKGSNSLKLSLDICNKGEVNPDKLIVSLLRKGNLITMIQDSELILSPGQSIRKQIELPLKDIDELQVRLIWFKLTKRWFKDEIIKLA